MRANAGRSVDDETVGLKAVNQIDLLWTIREARKKDDALKKAMESEVVSYDIVENGMSERRDLETRTPITIFYSSMIYQNAPEF